MSDHHPAKSKRRRSERRREDRTLKNQVNRHIQLFHIGQVITSEMNFDTLFDVIAEQTNRVMDSEKSSVFLSDGKDRYLNAFVSTDLKRNEIKIPNNRGIAGWVFQNKLPLIISDVYNDSRFYPEIDQKTGFKTKNMLCVPLINRKKECIGTLQVLNKKTGDFTEDDREALIYVSNYVTVAIENSKLYEDLKASNRAKERAIDHLSHELNTPLAIIASVFKIIKKHVNNSGSERILQAIDRGQRNIARLMKLQKTVDDIVKQIPTEEKKQMVSLLEDVMNIFEGLDDILIEQYRELLILLKDRMKTIYEEEERAVEKIRLDTIMNAILGEGLPSNKRKYPEIRSKIEKGLFTYMDKKAFKNIAEGLLKNAIENTPDEGLIDITASSTDNGIRMIFRDYGVGITEENQKNIFEGFFHTQSTDLYASKKPYDFNAGGAGLDLLRIKTLSKKFKFSVNFDSTRCQYIPLDTDLCEGGISECPFIQTRSECLSSGGTCFTLEFPRAV